MSHRNTQFALPSFDHLFFARIIDTSSAVAMNDKIDGAGDSEGRATNVKAPGGHDASNQRDGG